ncbi:MAG TPA: SprT family zinc-dependent metalloprotease [Thermodesulfobacteriota bacterium]|nr:SprT family zinc-dependent metalloprotease [Thermodesulfobacteriota bacterium]
MDYKIVYSDRKTLNITVERDRSIIVRAPKNTSIEKIEQVIKSKKLWLYEKTNHKQKYDLKSKSKEFISGESILYLGRHYRLDVVKDYRNGIYFDNKFTISKSSRPFASRLLREWYLQKAKEKIIPKAEFFAKQLGVKYNKILISNLKYRWGSCTAKDNLNFNWRLIKAPMFVIEYIIVHELAHLIEGNHTPQFWSIVSVQVPKYKKAREWLKEHGDLLESDL